MSDAGSPEEDEWYFGREQTRVKHELLRHYLVAFAAIIGQKWKSITFVDTFSGPWQSRSKDLNDTSFAIAAQQLKAACSQLISMGRTPPQLRAFFVEKDQAAYELLQQWIDRTDGIEITSRNADYADCIDDICDYISKDSDTFPFILIDPKGWKLPLKTITPLLQHDPGEAVVMLMTEHVRRFIGDQRDYVRATFDETFGIDDVHQWFSGIEKKDRDMAIVERYMSRLQQAGGFAYASAVQVLHGLKNRTHFHLIYLTRHHRGVAKFKDAERKAMETMESARAEAEKRSGKAAEMPLFADLPTPPSQHYDQLRREALTRMRRTIDASLENQSVGYDDLWARCMRLPLVWNRDVSDYLLEGRTQSRWQVNGMKPKQRVLKPGEGIRIGRE
ncbi:three-Cys-motif partner protein TcmP [Roseimaritima sediminicola]|uniref:three-Cys-motif partner protein TcmP n=1 Tax=Roseimaritima sediminicola TaxID=2662066 RepID=UPI00129833CA|nr:three-Cys-motif partner protein TcmP [Roseimaritima sediminicola]